MKLLLPLVIAGCGLAVWLRAGTVELRVSPAPDLSAGRRVGVNLGTWTSWGAEQLSSNVLKNPGFEPTIDRAIVIVRSADPQSFTDDTDWLARPQSFWKGGTYSIRTGSLAGRQGGIVGSSTQNGLTRFETADSISGLQPGDVVAVTAQPKEELPSLWWYSREGDASIGTSRGTQRPGGVGGVQSLRLQAHGGVARASSYLDAIGDRAGKLLPLRGVWQLSFWARSEAGQGSLRVLLRREGQPAFLEERVSLSGEWSHVSRRLCPDDSGPAGILELRFETAGRNEEIVLDEVNLQAVTGNTGAFRPEMVAALEALRPGYLRDWQGQLGDSFENRLAGAYGRRPFRYRPGGETSVDYGYSLPDFLELCDRTRAHPWVVLPTTLSDAEWMEAGRYLSAAADRFAFDEIIVEFGNENWNQLFRPAGIPERRALGAAARRAFHLVRSGSGGDRRLVPAVGEHAFSDADQPLLAPGVLFAIAPYWTFHPSASQGFGQLFPSYSKVLDRAARRGGAIYEMNAHSLGESATPEQVNRLVTSRAAGTAMAWHAIAAMSAGISRQCAYVLAGFDSFGDGRGRLVRLFGVTRDLSGGVRLRPPGAALAMLNRAVSAQTHSVETGSPDLQAIAFRAGDGCWHLAVASRRAEVSRLLIRFPNAGPLPVRALSLGGADPHANNEEQQQVSEVPAILVPNGRNVELTLPPYGFAVLLGEEVENGN